MNKLTKIAVCLALPLSGAVFAPVAVASTATTTFAVTATVVDSCSVTASSLAFGDYNGIAGDASDSVGTVTPTCTMGTFYTVALGAGLGNGATQNHRKLTGSGGATLSYDIYAYASRLMNWGDGTAGTGSRTNLGSGVAQPLMMYGRIPAGQSARVGAYSDVITVTVSY